MPRRQSELPNRPSHAILDLRKQEFAREEEARASIMSIKEGSRPTRAGRQSFLNPDVGVKAFGFSREEINATMYYEGQFKYSKRWGEGTLHDLESGSKYTGQFSNDRFHGDGHHTYPDGSTYQGQWNNGERCGDGTYVSADYLTYNGQWERGRRQGHGSQVYANGDKYEGQWVQGLCSGRGTYVWGNGSMYKGTWLNGRYDGPGVFISTSGATEHRMYRKGLLEKRDMKSPNIGNGKLERVIHTREAMHSPTLLPPLAPTQAPVKFCRGELCTPRTPRSRADLTGLMVSAGRPQITGV